jgi:ketosteroid isomerase-like protein
MGRARALLWLAVGVIVSLALRPLIGTSMRSDAATPSALDSLVSSERAFSAHSVEKGMRDAFLAYLADDAVIFRPLPINGKQSWESRAPEPGTLIWEPSFAEIAATGDLGYTTGPWEFRPPAAGSGAVPDSAIAHGHFVSVWRKQPDGAWKVIVDIGGIHEKPAHGVGSGYFTAGPTHTLPKKKKKKFDIQFDLRTIEQGCWSETHASDSTALVGCAAQDIRYYRAGALPILGVQAVRAARNPTSGRTRWLARGSGASASDDLGYTYGIIERMTRGSTAPPDSEVYLHVWRKDARGNWQIALAVENPLKK